MPRLKRATTEEVVWGFITLGLTILVALAWLDALK
jgi:hypothetical protein